MYGQTVNVAENADSNILASSNRPTNITKSTSVLTRLDFRRIHASQKLNSARNSTSKKMDKI